MKCGPKVSNKGNKQWIWLALDKETREIVGVHVGDCEASRRHRSRAGARKLWQSLPLLLPTMCSLQSVTFGKLTNR